ncbi:MAG: hypothetical protein AABZ64_02295 [Nitrospinota bacterium]
MAQETRTQAQTTFICPACGQGELPLPEGWPPQDTPYARLAELHDCEQAQTASFIFGDGHTAGFGGVVRDTGPDGTPRERWAPPRAAVAYHFTRQGRQLARAEAAPGCYPQPLYRNLSHGQNADDVFVAMAFLPHGEQLTPQLRAQGEKLAKSLK